MAMFVVGLFSHVSNTTMLSAVYILVMRYFNTISLPLKLNRWIYDWFW